MPVDADSSQPADAGADVSLGRPRFHVVAQRGWMNDPCAPGYVPSTGDFTMMYQWNPQSHLWDNISWGGVRSKDLVSWEYTSEDTIFTPDQPYDCKGIFTGCLYPRAPDGKEGLSIFYTSVPILPIHWSTPHPRGAEGVALATSADGGRTWIKHADNPVVRAEPDELAVTGFRDPAVIPWPALDAARGRSAPGLYGILSGGVQGETNGPRLFVYEIDPSDMTRWAYLQMLGHDVPRGLKPHAWTGDLGTNWECATVFTLSHAASGESRDVCVLGVEGGALREHVEVYRKQKPRAPERAARYCHWFFVTLQDGDMRMGAGGLVDWAELYALSVFAHPDGRRVGYGWFVELDLADEVALKKGWTGCLGVPRDYELRVYDGVVGVLGGALGDVGNFEVHGQRVVTMGTKPLAEMVQLRRGRLLQGVVKAQPMPQCYELLLTAAIVDGLLKVSLKHDDKDICTDIEYDPTISRLAIRRARSTPFAGVNTQDEIAPFTLLRFADGTTETLELRVYVDMDTIEVFANGRVALATRSYAGPSANLLSVEMKGGAAVLECEAWEMGGVGLVR